MKNQHESAVTRRKVLNTIAGLSAFSGLVGVVSAHEREESKTDSIAFEDLTAEAKRVFKLALNRGTYRTTLYRLPAQLAENAYVIYRGTKYDVNGWGKHQPAYEISPGVVDRAVTGTIVDAEDLDRRGQRAFNAALEAGTYDEIAATPEDFGTDVYVRRGDTTYELGLTIGTTKVVAIEPRKVE